MLSYDALLCPYATPPCGGTEACCTAWRRRRRSLQPSGRLRSSRCSVKEKQPAPHTSKYQTIQIFEMRMVFELKGQRNSGPTD